MLALRDQVQSYSSNRGTFNSQTIAKSETDARLELVSCRDRLAKLEALLGPEGDIELKELVERIEDREKRLKVLEAQVKAQDHVRGGGLAGRLRHRVADRRLLWGAQATNMLYGEIDQLSTAWSTLDEQNNAKVFNLLNLEEKVQRLNTDVRPSSPSPSFPVAFAADRFLDCRFTESQIRQPLLCDHATEGRPRCRQPEPRQARREAATSGRCLQRRSAQSRDPTRALAPRSPFPGCDVLTALREQTAAEREITLHQKNVRSHQESLAAIKRENSELVMRSEQNAKHITEVRSVPPLFECDVN